MFVFDLRFTVILEKGVPVNGIQLMGFSLRDFFKSKLNNNSVYATFNAS
jgi:hypothetical protein